MARVIFSDDAWEDYLYWQGGSTAPPWLAWTPIAGLAAIVVEAGTGLACSAVS